MSAADLIRGADRYLHRRVGLNAAFCYANEPGYTCVAVGEPLEIRADRLPAGEAKRVIDESCSGMDAIERTPLPECRFAVVFVPTASDSRAGEYIRGNKVVRGRITVLQADELVPRKGER